ncbi:hypothetical protein [Spirosoma endbachense]|uniref:Lipocalin-like domain-containing protein n=1 Tax=Spirosoma endbachense TaxID=2666025 RepID=A0A6P1W0E8_9BACT|nr:hypothetical protein [Spirosoma endbachense]QHV97480.1 hypothetical protein GJR95_21835 [Spirosoma endbachense]
MKRFNTFILAIAAVLVVSLSGCKKENDTVVQPDGTTTGTGSLAFVGKNLMMTSFQISPAIDMDGDGKIDPDLMVFMRPCDKDNTVVFEKGGKLSGSNGQLSCANDQADPSVVKPSTWSYNEQTKIIRIINGTDATDVSEWKVIEASSTTLKVEVSVKEDGDSHKAIMSWKAV